MTAISESRPSLFLLSLLSRLIWKVCVVCAHAHIHTHTTRNAPGMRGSTPETTPHLPILAKNWEGSQAGTRTKPPIYQLAFLVFHPKRKNLKSTTHHPEFIKSDKKPSLSLLALASGWAEKAGWGLSTQIRVPEQGAVGPVESEAAPAASISLEELGWDGARVRVPSQGDSMTKILKLTNILVEV